MCTTHVLFALLSAHSTHLCHALFFALLFVHCTHLRQSLLFALLNELDLLLRHAPLLLLGLLLLLLGSWVCCCLLLLLLLGCRLCLLLCMVFLQQCFQFVCRRGLCQRGQACMRTCMGTDER